MFRFLHMFRVLSMSSRPIDEQAWIEIIHRQSSFLEGVCDSLVRVGDPIWERDGFQVPFHLGG